MRIAFITLEYPPHIIGGAGIYAVRLVDELVKAGNDVVVFTPGVAGGKAEEHSGRLTVLRVPVSNHLPLTSLQFSLRLPGTFRMEDRKHNFDVIHFNSICYWFLIRKLSISPAVATLHHMLKDARESDKVGLSTVLLKLKDENNLFQQVLEKRTIGSVGQYIVDSKYTGASLKRLYRVPAGKIHVVPCGLNFIPGEGEKTVVPGVEGKKIILFVGRVNDPRKGLDLLLEALKLVVKKHNAVLVVAGSGDQAGAKEMVKSLGIQESVIFTGYVDDDHLKKLYLACDVYAVPSRMEGFGLTVLEAMAAGKPVVATRVGSIPELMEDGVHGTLVDPGDARGMAGAICRYLGDEGLARGVGVINKTYAAERFSWARTAAGTIDAYRQIMDGQHGPKDKTQPPE